MSASVSLELAFVMGRQGHLLHTLFLPAGAPRAALVFVHAFGEELAKSRHVVSATARRLAESGIAVCAVDLYGCGDSAGSLVDARVDCWTDDVVSAVCSMSERFGVGCHLWAMRSGALVAMAALRRWGNPGRQLVLWQPVSRGRLTVNEFLRLRTAASMMGATSGRESVDDLRTRLRDDGQVEVAGYPLGRAVADGLDDSELKGEVVPGTRISWFDVSASPERALAPATRRLHEQLTLAGAELHVERIKGPAFWSSGELQTCPQLVERTAEHVAQVLLV